MLAPKIRARPARSARLALRLAAIAGRRERDIVGNPVDGSRRVTAFAVIDSAGRALWKFSTPPPGIRSAERVEYGELPSGFRQDVAGRRRGAAAVRRRREADGRRALRGERIGKAS